MAIAKKNREAFWNRLHETVGRCNHCGRKHCPGKTKGSTLPKMIPLSAVLDAAKIAGLTL